MIDAEGGVPRQLTPEPSLDAVGTWSHDGKWIYFHSDRSGESQVWKMPSGGGPAVQGTRVGGVYAEESWDDGYLYYAKTENQTAIWRVPVDGGKETEVVAGPTNQLAWALSRSGIYYATDHGQGRRREYAIQFYDFESGEITDLYRKDGPFEHAWLAVSPDEAWVLYGEAPMGTSELMLVENFR